MDIRIMLADTESCGLAGPDERGSGVVEAAWLELDFDGNIIGSAGSFINPGDREIEERAAEIHGITKDMLVGMPTMDEFMEANWDDRPTWFIAHNKSFDLKFYAPHIKILHGSYCTLQGARRHVKGSANHQLSTLVQHLGLPSGTAHRAIGDVVSAHGLLMWILKTSGRTIKELVDLDRKPTILPHMPFGEHKGKAFLDVPLGYLRWVIARGDDMPPDVLLSAQRAVDVKGF